MLRKFDLLRVELSVRRPVVIQPGIRNSLLLIKKKSDKQLTQGLSQFSFLTVATRQIEPCFCGFRIWHTQNDKRAPLFNPHFFFNSSFCFLKFCLCKFARICTTTELTYWYPMQWNFHSFMFYFRVQLSEPDNLIMHHGLPMVLKVICTYLYRLVVDHICFPSTACRREKKQRRKKPQTGSTAISF